MNKELVGKKLKYVRDLKNLSMDNLKDEFNKNYGSRVSKSMISNWENGRYLISNKNLNLYSKYFKVYTTYFLYDDFKPSDYDTLNESFNRFVGGSDIDYDYGESGLFSRKSIRRDISDILYFLNIEGLKKVEDYANDLLNIDSYTLDESDEDKHA